ncbi:P-loop containing nucleoside triphosphate hydrolase protein [Lipomyces arxii]|uniref:P-loop containing nucleoside triphosphate hydrolase protein n=1 Tax=Lipomyces arxii TaxID=56418 RepID=UPI0034CFCF8A
MEDTFADLAQHCLSLLDQTGLDNRILIAVSGIPGSGKTTLGTAVHHKINEIWTSAHPSAPRISAFVPMDGFHLTRQKLASMPNAEEAIARRGAPFTFDPDGLLGLIRKLRTPIDSDTKTVYAPSFDHAAKDPVENDIAIYPTDRILIIEGNYLHLDQNPWHQIADLMNELWFVNVQRYVARERIIHRHIQAGIAKDESEAANRADQNDLVNGDYIIKHSLPPTRIIISIDDKNYS